MTQIRDIKSYSEGNEVSISPQETALREELIAAEGIVVHLKALVLDMLKNPHDLTSNVRRIAWLKAKKKTRKLREKLTRIHKDLPWRYSQAEGARIILGLRNISNVQLEMSASLSRLKDQASTTSQNVDQTISSIEELRQITEQRFESLESTISSSSEFLQRLPNILSLEIEARQQNLSAIRTTSTQSLEATANTTNLTSTIQTTYRSIIIRSQYQYPTSCGLSCHCRCHLPQRIDSPDFLSSLLGRIFIGYKGLPALAKKCTDERCKKDSQPKVYLTYSFPQWWIVDRMLLLLAQWYETSPN